MVTQPRGRPAAHHGKGLLLPGACTLRAGVAVTRRAQQVDVGSAEEGEYEIDLRHRGRVREVAAFAFFCSDKEYMDDPPLHMKDLPYTFRAVTEILT